MGMGLYDCWLAGLEAELKPKWVKVLEAFILGMCAEKLYLGNPQAEMEGFFNMQWDYFLKSARLKFINAAATPAFKDKYSYVAGTKDAVVLFMICVNDFFNNYLKEKTEGFIESKYALWSVRKDT